jgi:hypothetical protein
MNDFEKLELEVETLRELTDEQLGGVAGGAVSGIPCDPTYALPSRGGLFTMACPTVGTIIQTG